MLAELIQAGLRSGSVELMAMQEWTDDFITHAQQDLVAMVKDWNYDYGAEKALLRDVAWDGPEASSRGKH